MTGSSHPYWSGEHFRHVVLHHALPGLGYRVHGGLEDYVRRAADSQLLVTTSSVSEDIYHASLHPDAEQKHLVFVSRLVAFIIGLLAIALSQLPRSIFDKVLFAWGGLGAAFGPALVLTLWWPKTTRNGVLAGMLTGFFTVIIWDNIPWGGHLYSLVPGFLAALVVTVLVSLMDRGGEAAPATSGEE